jgi:hypothetical protein
LKKQHGEGWRLEWEKIQRAAKFYDKHTQFYTNLFSIAPRQLRAPHAPRKSNFWFALSDTQNYFRQLTGKPHWTIVQDILFPDSKKGRGHQHAQSEYERREKYLKQFDENVRLDKLSKLYEVFKPVILQVLESGRPLWEEPHREKAQEIFNQMSPDEVMNMMCMDPANPPRKKSRRKNSASN